MTQIGGVSEYNNGTTMDPYGNIPQKEGVIIKNAMDLFPIYVFQVAEGIYYCALAFLLLLISFN